MFNSCNYSNVYYKANIALQEARLRLANNDLEKAQSVLDEKQKELDCVKSQYQAALAEKQKLIDAADVCRRKMQAAAQLINGLAEEKIRWTEQSKGFRNQMERLEFYLALNNLTSLFFSTVLLLHHDA